MEILSSTVKVLFVSHESNTRAKAWKASERETRLDFALAIELGDISSDLSQRLVELAPVHFFRARPCGEHRQESSPAADI